MRAIIVLMSVVLAGSAAAQEVDPQTAEGFVTDDQSTEPSGGGWDYDWSSNYYGLSAGYGFAQQGANDIAGIVSGAETTHGIVYGGYMGHNMQLSRFVLGTEMDFSLANISGPFTIPGSAWACETDARGCESKVEWFGSFRGRAGVALNAFLPYATAGVAIGGIDSTFRGAVVNERVNGLGYGYVFGGGLEYAPMKNLTLRAEALHYQLSDVKEAVGLSEIAVETAFNVVRLGVDVKF